MPEPVIDRTWPITIATLRKALGFSESQGNADELALFAQAACEQIDSRTGRDTDPTRHMVTILVEGVATPAVPISFINAARETAKLWYQQSKNGPVGVITDPSAQLTQGPPMGAAFPRKVEGWLSQYPPPPGFGQPTAAAE